MKPEFVAAQGPFDPRAALAVLAAHGGTGSEETDVAAGWHRRLLRLGGEHYPLTCEVLPEGVRLWLGTVDHGVREAIAARVRHWFDLDADVVAIDTHLRASPVLGPLVEARPGIRVTRFADGFEAAVITVIGQQVSLIAARLFTTRLVAAYGGDGPAGLRIFPAAAVLAGADAEALRATVGLTTARTRTLQAVAGLFADGFRLDPGAQPAQARRVLGATSGVGPWTLGYLSVRALADPDAFPESDAVLRRRLSELRGPAGAGSPDPQAWSPYRSYAAARLWLPTVESEEARR